MENNDVVRVPCKPFKKNFADLTIGEIVPSAITGFYVKIVAKLPWEGFTPALQLAPNVWLIASPDAQPIGDNCDCKVCA